MSRLVRVRWPSDGIRLYVNKYQERKARKLIEKFPNILRDGYLNGSCSFANRMLKIILTAIKTHKPPRGSNVSWPPLSPTTIKRYGDHGIYLLTGQYLNNIHLKVDRFGKKVYVGLPPRIQKLRPDNKPGKLTLGQVARVLEFGTNEEIIPSRPLWRPSYKSAGGNKQLTKDIVDGIRNELKKYD